MAETAAEKLESEQYKFQFISPTLTEVVYEYSILRSLWQDLECNLLHTTTTFSPLSSLFVTFLPDSSLPE